MIKKSRNLPFGLQLLHLGRGLERKGVSRDTVDLKHVLDRTLTYKENKRVLNNYMGRNVFPNEIKGRTSSYELYEKAKEVNVKRSNRSQFQDERRRANNTYFPDSITQKQYLKWRKNPARSDIEGVDTRGGYF